MKLAVGTHNIRSIARGLALGEAGPARIGRRDPKALRHGRSAQGPRWSRGGRVREYVPIGEMIPGMAYLVRRLLENT